jgi:hypothetical protein
MAHNAPISPLAPQTTPEVPPLDGVRFAAGPAGIRYAGRTDVMLALLDEGATVAGVFTKSRCPSAPVDWCRAKLKGGKARALLVNSGNANAFTGKAGAEAVKFSAKLAAAATGARENQIFLASTGVIGEPLDATKFGGVINGLVTGAKRGEFLAAAQAIMTTDTFPKGATATAKLGKATVTICGIAKGAGMIALAASCQRPACAPATSVSMTPSNADALRGSPITPVEARNTSPGLQPAALAVRLPVNFVASRPFLPVKALALPELTTSARAVPPLSWARHQSTGAEGHLERVNTPATVVPLSKTASRTSVRPW